MTTAAAWSALLVYGRYQLLFPIARGGMGEVWAARQKGEGGFQRLVALKRIHAHLASDADFVNMFLDEGRLAANIRSPNVLSAQDVGRGPDDTLFLVMDLVAGVSLSVLMARAETKRIGLEPAVALRILVDAASGLHDAHEAKTPSGKPLGIIHRDVSPQNVLVDVAGQTRITDFGVARATQRLANTSDGSVKGKVAYFSPEQAAGAELDRRSDVFAMGVVAWETLARERLFKGQNPAATLEKLLFEPIPRLDREWGVPRVVADAVARALLREPGARYQTAKELADALREAGRATTGVADRDVVGRFVGRVCGTEIESLEKRIASVVADESRSSVTPPAPASLEIDIVVDNASGVRASTTDQTSAGAAARKPAEVSPPREPRRARWLLAGGLLVLAALAVLAWKLTRENDAEVDVASSSASPASASLPIAADQEEPEEPEAEEAEAEEATTAAQTEPIEEDVATPEPEDDRRERTRQRDVPRMRQTAMSSAREEAQAEAPSAMPTSPVVGLREYEEYEPSE
jgi:serine/threonine-protein kinase